MVQAAHGSNEPMLTRLYPWLKLLVMALSAMVIMSMADHGYAAETAEEVGPSTLTGDSREEALHRIEDYFNQIDTLKADFLQLTTNNTLSEGRVYIRRPGLLRVEYDPPVQFLIVGDGRWLNMIDYEVKDVSRWAIEDTPLQILVKPDLNLKKDVDVRDVEERDGILRLTVSSPDVPGQERVSFTFSQTPFELRQWEINDGNGNITRVALTNTEKNVEVPRSLFTFEDPRDPRRGPRR
jgi:outer membrane lipoprotein-sorting protein